jgi:hypothetical protein
VTCSALCRQALRSNDGGDWADGFINLKIT